MFYTGRQPLASRQRKHGVVAMQSIFPDLWETDLERPAPGLTTHAYLLTRPQGNILFYNTSHDSALAAIEKLGGIRWQLLKIGRASCRERGKRHGGAGAS